MIPLSLVFEDFWSGGFTKSILDQHVLPYYVPNKLMPREIDYQTTGEGGMTKGLKEQK